MIDISRPRGELWLVLARIDGLCGRLLGRAVSKGFDDVRAWVCCFVSGFSRVLQVARAGLGWGGLEWAGVGWVGPERSGVCGALPYYLLGA